nr:CatB-related O-acetyltransferase [Catellatospora sichuanensis]
MIRRLLVNAYRIPRPRVRSLVLWLLRRLEADEFTSPTLREIFRKYWGVEIGMYSHGCFVPWMIDRDTTIGRYCSIAANVRIVNHNHPLTFKSTSGLFFNPELGLTDKWLVEHRPLDIGSDVWIGANAVILPEVNRIGHGAVIGAGAVVNRDVPPYAVVLGNPGRVVKYRFSEQTIAKLLAERWWERDIDQLGDLTPFQTPLTEVADVATPVGAGQPAE